MANAEFEIPIIANSDPASGALNIASDGSAFEIELDDPIMIPETAQACVVEVQEATVWWTIPNISAEKGNNKFYFKDTAYDPNFFSITIPDGLYSLGDLASTLDREIQTITGTSGSISLIADSPTQRVHIRLNTAGLQIDFTQPDTFREILGFDSQLIPLAPSLLVTNVLGENVAQFNEIDYFLLHSDIVQRGIRVNNSYSQTIAQILIDKEPGQQILSRPFNPPKVQAWYLRGQTRDRIRFWLTDQNNNNLDTNGETFSCRIVIKYTHQVKMEGHLNA